MSLDLKFATSGLYPLLLLLLAAAFTLLIYRRTVPPTGRGLRRTLAALRTFSLAAALLLLFEPILSLAVQRTQKPVVAVLLDRSASMTLADSSGSRADKVKTLLAQSWRSRWEEAAEVVFLAFSDSVRELSRDSLSVLRFDGDGSNLAAALSGTRSKLAGRHLGAVLLLSDGASNLGRHPLRTAEEYGVPILTVRLGSASQARDAMISEVVTNEIAYAETQVPVEVTVSAIGYAGRRTRLRLFSGEREVATQELELPADHTQITARLTLMPESLGLNRYTLRLDSLAQELTLENNHRAFYVRVLKSRLNLWIFTGAPSADYAFLQRTLANDPNYQVQGFVQRPGGRFYSQPGQLLPAFGNPQAWEAVDALVLVDFPRRDTDRALLETIARQLNQNNRPLFYLHGPGVDPAALWQLRGALPLASMPLPASEHAVELELEPAGLSHPLTRPLTEPAPGTGAAAQPDLIHELPPLYCNVTGLAALPGSEVLAGVAPAGTARRVEPLWIAQRNAARKTLAIFSYGLWRWHMLLQAVDRSPATYENMMRGVVRWLVTREDAKLVRLESNKEIYRGGEQIELLAQVYREDYRPLEGAQVKARITGPHFQQELILQDAGNGLYRARLQVLGGGEYQYQGTAELSGKQIGEDSGKFSVEPFSLEFLQTRLNEPLLQQIAEASGGTHLAPDSLASALDKLELKPLMKYDSFDWAFWGKPLVLFVMLFTLAAEWFLRKRQGML